MQLSSLVRVCKQLTAVFCMMMLGVNLSATPEAPVLCIDGAVCVEASDGYGLQDAIVGVPFPIEMPVPPTITSEAMVTPSTIGANKVNGRRLILGPGDYGNLTFNTQDQEIVITTGVVIGNLSVRADARRLRFRADPIRSGQIGAFQIGVFDAPEDIVFDGINVTYVTGGQDSNYLHGTRIALINSYIYQYAYVVASFPASTEAVLRHCIIANNVIWGHGIQGAGAQSATRFHVPQELVYVDNRVNKTGSEHHTFRVHGSTREGFPDANNVYIARNQFERNPHMIKADGGSGETGLGSVWYEDNDWYFALGWGYPMQMAEHDAPDFLSLRNNVMYSASGNWPPQHRSNWIYQSNQLLPYQEPPAWNFR